MTRQEEEDATTPRAMTVLKSVRACDNRKKHVTVEVKAMLKTMPHI